MTDDLLLTKGMRDPSYPLTIQQQKRMVFLLRKYMATVEHSRLRRHQWDLTKCDDETRKLFSKIGAATDE